MPPRKKTVAEIKAEILDPSNFFEHVPPNGPRYENVKGNCWFTTFPLKKQLDGTTRCPQRRSREGRRKALTHFVMDITDWDGLYVLHNCDMGHRGCIRPSHLRIGDAQMNVDDRAEAGHQVTLKGEDHGYSKLNEHQVRFIKKYNKAHGDCPMYSQRELAKMFEVDQTQICNIVLGRVWKHV